MKKPRIYVDTSVFGGVFDDEFKRASVEFFRQAQVGFFDAVVSELVEREIAGAPKQIIDFFKSTIPFSETVKVTTDTYDLAEAYVIAKIVGEKSMGDAMHVALATVAKCEMIVSWNFKHIVHFDKITLYNAMNVSRGYGQVAIYSPLEII